MNNLFMYGIILCILGLSIQAESDNYLTASDYKDCDDRETKNYGVNVEPSEETINSNALSCHGNTMKYDTFKCCYVQYEVDDTKYWGCHFIKNTAKSIKFYKKHTLKNLDGVHILCGSSYLKITGMIISFFIFLF